MRSVQTFHSAKRLQRILACAQDLGIDPISENLRRRLGEWQAWQAVQ
jgi:hypothetical protein